MEKHEARKTVIDALVRDQVRTIETGMTEFAEVVFREGFTGFANMSNAHLVNAALGMGIDSQSSDIATAVAVLGKDNDQSNGGKDAH